MEFKETILKDSGNRTVFGDGAMRDMGDGKGRCDLLPLKILALYTNKRFFSYMDDFIRHPSIDTGIELLQILKDEFYRGNIPQMFLEVAKHYEDGAKKYSERNWEQGMPHWVFCDSAIRHYLKWMDNQQDEPHDRAVVWNILGAMWTLNTLAEYDASMKKIETVVTIPVNLNQINLKKEGY